MSNISLTPLQTQLIKDFLTSDFYEQGFESILWMDYLMDETGMNPQQFGGVVASLRNKGIIETHGTMLNLTLVGIDWVKKNIRVVVRHGKSYSIDSTTGRLVPEVDVKSTYVIIGQFGDETFIGTTHYNTYEEAVVRSKELMGLQMKVQVKTLDEALG